MRSVPPVIPLQKGRLGFFVWAGAVAVAVSLVILYFFDPAQGGLYPPCFLKMSTGLDCPGCGGLRATHQLLHGHLLAAFALNPLFIVAIPIAAFLAGRQACERILGRKWPRIFRHTTAVWIGAGTLLAFGVLRNLPWHAWFGNQAP